MGFAPDDEPDPFGPPPDPFGDDDTSGQPVEVPALPPTTPVERAQKPVEAPEPEAPPVVEEEPDLAGTGETASEQVPEEPSPAEVAAAFGEPAPLPPPAQKRAAPAAAKDALQRTPPHDLEAEVCVLGAMLLDEAVAYEVLQTLQEPDFYRESHRRIFAAMVALHEAASGLDAVLVREELRKRGDLEAAGGGDALIAILDKVPTAAHAAHYAAIVRAKAIRRRQIEEGDRLIRAAYDDTDDGVDPVAALTEASTRLLEVAHGASNEKIECIGGGDLLDMKLDRPKLLVGWDDLQKSRPLAEGQLILTSGPPKLGKSLLLCEMSIELAKKNGEWLGFPCHGPVNTLIIEAEGGLDLVQDWLATMAKDVPKEVLNRLRMPKKLPKIDITKPKDVLLLRRVIEAEEASLMWLDPFFRLHTSDENKNEEMKDVMAALEELRRVTRCAQALAHHTSRAVVENTKGRATVRTRGASVIDADADTITTLDHPDESAEDAAFFAFWDNRRGPKPMNMIVYRDAVTLRHRIADLGSHMKKAGANGKGGKRGSGGGAGGVGTNWGDLTAEGATSIRKAVYEALQDSPKSDIQLAAILGVGPKRVLDAVKILGMGIHIDGLPDGTTQLSLPEGEKPFTGRRDGRPKEAQSDDAHLFGGLDGPGAPDPFEDNDDQPRHP